MNRSNDLSWGQGETKSGMALFRKCWDILRVSDRILGVDDLQNISSLFSYNQHTYIHSVSWYWPLSITSQNISVVLRAILTWLPSVQLTISRPAGRQSWEASALTPAQLPPATTSQSLKKARAGPEIGYWRFWPWIKCDSIWFTARIFAASSRPRIEYGGVGA